MKLNRRDDLVSMTAIVAGAVVSVAVTIGSMILSGGDESRDFMYATPVGMEAVEWEAIGTYKTIEAMTATYPTHEMVDQTLDALGTLALDNPSNGFVQGLYLKALRVSEYYAMEGGDERRALWLQGRFDLFAASVMRYERAGLESIHFITQRLERSCAGSDDEMDRLVAVMNRFPDSGDVAALFVQGLEKARSCGAT